MRTRFWKLSALVLALMLALTGCSLIEIDQEMDMAEVVATVGDAKITKGEVIDNFNYQVEYMNTMYAYYGLGSLTNEDIETLKDDVLEVYIINEIMRQKAAELGLTDFSDESFATADADAEAYFEELIVEHAAHTGVEDPTTEAGRAAVIAHLEEEGNSLEMVKKTYRDNYVGELVLEHVVANVEVTEDEIKVAYDAKVAADESTYSSSGYLYELYNTYEGYSFAWNPEGYRTVKHILFLLSEEQNNELNELESSLTVIDTAIEALEAGATPAPEATADPEATPAKTLEELNAEKATIEAQIETKKAEIVASFKEKTDAVYARLEAGESFDALMAELGEDPGMKSEPSMSKGYLVCATSSTWDTAFRDGAMALEKIGDVSEPILSASGLHIIYYNSDVPAGPVDMETLREELTETARTEKEDAVFSAQVEAWKTEMNIKKYPKVLG